MAPTSVLFSVLILVPFVAGIVTGATSDMQRSRAMQLGQQKDAEDGGGTGYLPIPSVPPSGGYPITGSPPYISTNPGYNPPYKPTPTVPMYPGSGSSTGLPNYSPPSYGTPSTGLPNYSPPSYGTPSTGLPNYSPPSYGTPSTGLPNYSPPSYGTPSGGSYGTPSGGGYGTPMGGMGHGSCKFWSMNHGSWPDILSTISTISAIFGKPAASMFGGQTTLLQALENSKNDPYNSLLRESTAALINSYAYKGSFPFTPDVVKAKFGSSLKSSQAAAAQATEFARANVGL